MQPHNEDSIIIKSLLMSINSTFNKNFNVVSKLHTDGKNYTRLYALSINDDVILTYYNANIFIRILRDLKQILTINNQ